MSDAKEREKKRKNKKRKITKSCEIDESTRRNGGQSQIIEVAVKGKRKDNHKHKYNIIMKTNRWVISEPETALPPKQGAKVEAVTVVPFSFASQQEP